MTVVRFGGDPVVDPSELLQRLELATVASCTCVTKTPDISAHDPMCRYRLLAEAAFVIWRFLAIEADT